jgi:hypothetical protein
MTVEDQLREAIAHHTVVIADPPDRWDEIEARAVATGRHHNRRRTAGWTTLALVAAAIAGLVIIPTIGRTSTHRVTTKPPATHPGPAPTSATSTPSSPTSLPPSPTSGPATTAPTSPPARSTASPLSPYQGLWPFQTLTEARAWEASFQAGGHQPWHLDAGQTALSFTNGYLGYTEINQVVSQTLDSKGAHVAVGYRNPNGQLVTAAIIHLVRFGSDQNAPWEVVGTDDSPSFTLTLPSYGQAVRSPTTVGGMITGVDESIKVEVLQPSSSSALGSAPGVPAGGTSSPWHTTVTWQGATDPVLTIAASTGGHLQGVERFTVTAMTVGK